MNISIKNENINVMNFLDVEIIKTLDGSFTKEDLEREFINLYYNKVIIDITAIRNYYDENTLFNFLSYFEPSRVILVLNNTEFCNNPAFLKNLVEKGYYNFSKNASGISFLVNKPNTFEDVKKFIEGATLYNPLNTNEITAEENYYINKNKKQKVIGIKNITPHAGSTTLMYMMTKMLKKNYSVKAIEFQKKDCIFFNSEDIISSDSIDDLNIKLKTLYTFDIILIDLNDLDGKDICDDIIYLMEAGTIRLNKLLKSGLNISDFSINNKIVLSRSVIKDSDLVNFTYETKIKIFYNLTDFNDREENSRQVGTLLNKLGFRG